MKTAQEGTKEDLQGGEAEDEEEDSKPCLT
jgi:hypothetical protein